MNTLFTQLGEYLLGLGPDVVLKPAGNYYGFWRAGKVFAYVHVHSDTIRIHVKPELPVQPGLVSRIGPPRHKVSRSEISLSNFKDLERAKDLLRYCYNPSSFRGVPAKITGTGIVGEPDHRVVFPQSSIAPITIQAVGAPKEIHTANQTTWREVSSLRLVAGMWQMNENSPLLQSERALASLPLSNTGKYGRYVRSIEVGGTANFGLININLLPGNAVGCRVFAEALARLSYFYGGIEKLPAQLYIRVREGPFLARGLLMLRAFCDPEMRRDIRDHYSWSHIAAQSSGTWRTYEERVVGELLHNYGGYVAADTGLLCLTDVRSKPDGFFINAQSKTAIIVEAKKDPPDFTDGTAQIMQYYAQAKHHPEFKDWVLRMCLVTSGTEPTNGYTLWARWMKSERRLDAFVAE